ncbi:CopD family protein [Microvirga sp. VF16]|uniref:copper resistance CopC/CopD family protein n=1 Tax=Microvirga sp. VF16 TaxID=2807101 RepID=UPI00193E4651|nr:CopD family protein [Microvirga sp. VF16]QRM27672.1 copper resistance protein CopC [Microvirga sp. VF16]
MIRVVVSLISLVFVGFCGCNSALAHAALIESHPYDGAIVELAPSSVRLRFNEPVSPLAISLTDAKGNVHRGLASSAHNEVLEVAMPSDLPQGSQILSYRVTSGDGHPIGGLIVFSIGVSTKSGLTPEMEGSVGVHRTLWLTRMALYLGLFVGAGGVFFQAWLAPISTSGRKRVLAGLLVMGLLAAITSLGLHGLDVLGLPLAGLRAYAGWAAGWQTSFGSTVAAGMTALFIAWIGLHGSTRWRRACSLAAMIGVGLSLTLSGHASTAAPQWLTRSAVFLHSVGVAYWVGALIPLLWTVRQANAQALAAVRRFSIGAVVAVAILTLAGLLLAAIQVADPANLTSSAYGRVLIAKTLIVAALIGLAALNRLRLTPTLVVPSNSGGAWLVRSIATEIVLVFAVLALVGLWRFTPPPRAVAVASETTASASTHLHSPRLMAQVTLSPGRAGAVQARIVIASGNAEKIAPKEVSLILMKPDDGIEPIKRRARKAEHDGWEIDALVLAPAGVWQTKVEILIDDFEKASLEGKIVVRP